MERETESDFPTEDYEAHQTAQDAAYAAEYRRWVSTLSEPDRQRLTLDGILEPDCSIRAGAGSSGGAIEESLITGRAGTEGDSFVPTLAAVVLEGSFAEQLADAAGISTAQATAALDWIKSQNQSVAIAEASDIIARLLSEFFPQHHRIDLHLVGTRLLAFKFLLNRHGTETLTHLAERGGCSKQLLSHHARLIGDRLGNFQPMGGKRSEARSAYAEAQRESWSALTAEERKARRRGQSGIIGTAQSAPHAAQI
jgi:hypothetical protein